MEVSDTFTPGGDSSSSSIDLSRVPHETGSGASSVANSISTLNLPSTYAHPHTHSQPHLGRAGSKTGGVLSGGGKHRRNAPVAAASNVVRPAIPFRGTTNYMAPEVIRSELLTDRSDVWSVGCTVWEMFTGKRPWHVRSRAGRAARPA